MRITVDNDKTLVEFTKSITITDERGVKTKGKVFHLYPSDVLYDIEIKEE